MHNYKPIKKQEFYHVNLYPHILAHLYRPFFAKYCQGNLDQQQQEEKNHQASNRTANTLRQERWHTQSRSVYTGVSLGAAERFTFSAFSSIHAEARLRPHFLSCTSVFITSSFPASRLPSLNCCPYSRRADWAAC